MSTARPFYYFDNNATTRIAPEVLEAMLPFLTEHWGNPSSGYTFAGPVARALAEARRQVAELIHASPEEIFFTSGGTESINTALHSALAARPDKRHVLTTQVEHSASLKVCESLQRRGYAVTGLPVETDGSLPLGALQEGLRPDTAVASIMWANNETGVLFPMEEVAALCQAHGVLLHTDAVQVPGKLPIDVREVPVDMLSLSAHKLHAPKGIGLLFVRKGTPFHPYLLGGSQERGRRGGTENVPYIIGFGKAAEIAQQGLGEKTRRIRGLRDRFEEAVLGRIPGSFRNGHREARVCNTSNLGFEGVEAETLLRLLDAAGICASSGSACSSGSLQPSHVLRAMRIAPSRARGCIRFSFGMYNTEEEVDYLVDQLPRLVAEAREAPRVPA